MDCFRRSAVHSAWWALCVMPALLGANECRPVSIQKDPPAAGGGEVGGGEAGGGEACGSEHCKEGTVCCNALCGLCAPPGVACVQGCPDDGSGGGGAEPHDAGKSPDPDPDPARVCGGIVGAGCEASEFCNYGRDAGGDGCGIADGQGVCQTRPELCTREYAPVCGCDGKTHPNACSAHAAGVSIDHEGACGAGEPCGNIVCGAGLECCDPLCGTCVAPGHACVLGCSAPPPVPTCGGIAALPCAKGQFCNYEPPVGLGCDGTVADTAGQCEAVPWGCTDDWTPVCGCDRTTYGNRCEAHAAGASVLHEGMCTVTECESIGGEPRYSDGASIPSCSAKEEDHGPFSGPKGELPFEPTRCCVPAP